MIDYRELIVAGNAATLAACVRELTGASVDADRLQDACQAALRRTEDWSLGRLGVGYETDWSEDTWRSWFKARVQETTPFPVGEQSTPDAPTCILHLGFATVVETAEHLARLWIQEPKPTRPPRPARSKIGSTNLKTIRPVDTVAHRVAPPPHNNTENQ